MLTSNPCHHVQPSDAEAKGCGSGSSLTLTLTGLALHGERDSDAFTVLTRDDVHLRAVVVFGRRCHHDGSFPAALARAWPGIPALIRDHLLRGQAGRFRCRAATAAGWTVST